MRGRIHDALAVLVDGVAEEPRSEERDRLRLELIFDAHRGLHEAGPGDAIALEVVDPELGRHAVLLGWVTQALGPEDRERLIAELVANEHGAAGEPALPDLIAHEVRGGVVDDALAVLVGRRAEADGPHDGRRARRELVDERRRPAGERRDARAVALVVIAARLRRRLVERQHAEQDADEKQEASGVGASAAGVPEPPPRPHPRPPTARPTRTRRVRHLQ
jgi:hypothetical protein